MRNISPRSVFDSLSPLDYRYWGKDLAKYLSEEAFMRYKLAAEIALLKTIHKHGLCSLAVVKEIEKACDTITAAKIYKEEERIMHDIRALVNCVRKRVSDKAKPYVHMTATSQDIVDTANAARYRDVTEKVLLPALMQLEATLIKIALHEAKTVQVGRTHGQHAVPITFGFAISGYVSRLGQSIEAIRTLATELRGKFAGAVGAYNASSLFFKNPERFEADLLGELGLKPTEQATQMTQAEPMVRLLCEITICCGILANLADDMRHLQRSEIGEIGEEFGSAQVGSSTMPHKRNPINFENVKSMWKTIAPRLMTALMDQISEHQRDLTNSASARTYGETIAYATVMTERLNRAMKKISIDKKSLKRNLSQQKDLITAEPLYLLLAFLGHPNAHEKIRLLTLQAQRKRQPLQEIALRDIELRPYLARITARQRNILSNPELYTGIAARKATQVAKRWKRRLSLR